MDFIPFMILTAVVVVAVAGWGYLRSGAAAPPRERVPEAERAFAECLRARGVEPPELAVYRDPAGGLVIVGPHDLDAATRRALSECDEEIAARFQS